MGLLLLNKRGNKDPHVQTHVVHIFVIQTLMEVCSMKEQAHRSRKEDAEINRSDAGCVLCFFQVERAGVCDHDEL
jgi:hypothetical protein